MTGRLTMSGNSTGYGSATFGKAESEHRNGAAAGAGIVLGTAGLLGGGIPGERPNSGRLGQVDRSKKVAASRHLVSAGRGGIFGYREDAHRVFLNQQLASEKDHGGKPTTRVNHYWRGRGTGKIAPEKQIIRHMRAGRTASNVALAGGIALAGAGTFQPKKTTIGKKSDNFGNDAMIAGGATTAGLAGGGSLVLTHQGRKWAQRSAANVSAAQKLNHKLGGYDERPTRNTVPDIAPHKSAGQVTGDHKRVFAGRSSKATEAAGQLRGAASQQRYFAGVYGKIGQVTRKVGAAGALVATAGLGAKYLQPKPAGIAKLETTMPEHQAHELARRYDTRGPLPKTLSRDERMRAYEARYVASGGKKGEKWKHRADAAEVGRNIGLAGATLAAGSILAGRGKRTGPLLRKLPGASRVRRHHLETAGLASATAGGTSELYGEHARSRRASYANSPAGVAGSALSRMRAYTPGATP